MSNLFIPQTELAMRGSYGVGKGPLKGSRALVAHFDQKKMYLVTLAVVSSRRKVWLRAQTCSWTGAHTSAPDAVHMQAEEQTLHAL